MKKPNITILQDLCDEQEKNNMTRKYFYLKIKRITDCILAFIGIVVVLPGILILAILIKMDSPGPVFFKHKRIGKDGKPLYIYKFRSMVVNAEELLNSLDHKQKKEFYKNFKFENDFRLTRIGKFLRNSSLDELPQLLNIIKGDMSIVGPRPVVQIELEKYGENKHKFLSVTPGLTGYWQANGRSNTTYEERIEMELYYIDHCSLRLDFKIMLHTVGAVIRKEGAK